ncbi:MAG: sensor histidine kinase [Candidatus Omnitrophota bacterium]
MTKIEDYKFEFGARAIIQMGEELIGHPSTALSELVKNSYDADSIDCKVYIHIDSDRKKSFLFVVDSGCGMDKNVLFGEWLKPSMSSKRNSDGKSNVFKRNLLGSKGIGRLAAMALGDHLSVVTKTENEESYNWISLNREQFKEEVLVSAISFPGGSTDTIRNVFSDKDILAKRKTGENCLLLKVLFGLKDDFEHGTLIVVEGLDESIEAIVKEDFSDAEIKVEDSSFMMAFRTLITPLFITRDIQDDLLKRKIIGEKFIEQKKKDSFKLLLGINLYDDRDDSGKVNFREVESLSILQHYDYRVFGIVNNDGSVKGHYSCQRLEKDKQEKEFSLTKEYVFSDEKSRKRDKAKSELKDESDVKSFYFDIRVYDRDIDSIDKIINILKQSQRELSRSYARKLMDKLLRFRISKNGFGVKPYGEEAIDWMELGQRRVQQPVQTIGPNQILGYVFLFSPENDGLNEKTNREGFYENKALNDLKKIIRAILIELGRRRYQYRLRHSLGRTVKNRLNRPDTIAYLDYISSTTSDKNIIKKSETFVKSVTTVLDNMEHTLTFSERLASLGSSLELVYHELAQPLAQLGGTRYSLQLKKDKIEMQAIREKFIEDISNLSAAISVLDELKSSLEPAVGIARPKLFYPMKTFMKVCVLFKQDIEESKIDIQQDDSLADYQIKDYEYALWISFLNIINNAVYWLKQGDGDKKAIRISLENKDTLVLSNNGPLIPEDENYIDTIFEYGVTSKPEKNATGLGLSFTRNILQAHDWEVWAENRKSGPAFLMKKVVKSV